MVFSLAVDGLCQIRIRREWSSFETYLTRSDARRWHHSLSFPIESELVLCSHLTVIQSGHSHKATVHCGCARISVLTATTARILSAFVCAYACKCTHHTCISREAETSASSSKYQYSKMFYYTHTRKLALLSFKGLPKKWNATSL